ncbi:hypothetical protein Tco_1311269 [Tanacetum coccineum]
MASLDYRLNPIYTIKECSSCGSLYSKECFCSNMSSVGKFVHDSNKAPDSPPHAHTFLSNQRHCFHCKDVLGDGEFCQQCTCMRCGSGLSKGLCLICASRYGNNPNPNSLNDSLNISENVSQSPPLIDHHCCYGCDDSLDGIFCQRCTCESCGNDAHYGYNCPPQVSIIPNPEPCNNQTVDELPQTLLSFDLTCYSGDGTSFTYDSTPNFFDDLLTKKEKELLQKEQAAYVSTSQQFNFIYDDDDDEESSIPLSDVISKLPSYVAITPVLSTEEPVNSLIIEDEHLDTILATESDEVIKSSVENLVQNPSVSKDECDDDESSHEEVIHEISFKTYLNPLFDLDEEIISSEFNPIHNEDLDSTLKNDRFDTESYLLESLLNRDTLMASSPKIDSLLDEFSGELITIPPRIVREHEEYISMMERLLYDNSSPRLPESFQANSNMIIESLPTFPIPVKDSDSLREEIDIFPGPDDSIPLGIKSDDYDSEGDDNSTSLPEFESFHVDYLDSGDSTIDVVEDIPVDVPNILPTHPTLHMDFDFILSHNDLGSDLDVSSPSADRNKIYDPGICIEVKSMRFLATHSPVIDTLLPFSSKNKDKVFNHGVLASKEKSLPSSSHRGFKASKLFHHKSPMMIYGGNIPILDVPFLHFYPP